MELLQFDVLFSVDFEQMGERLDGHGEFGEAAFDEGRDLAVDDQKLVLHNGIT